jgi:NADPH:quinone reductase-like Zn-dependent oxidoreductase
MKAVRIHRYGGPEVLIYEEAPRPKPATGEVLVRVHAAGVNPLDWRVREGHLKETLPQSLPLIPGWDLSGVVEEVGSSSRRFKEGDEVFSFADLLRDGAYAEYVAVRESHLAFKPRSADHVHAAAIPLAGLAAWKALFDGAKLSVGQRVLIHAAAGGVGSYAVQLAKRTGAYVIGTASAGNHDFLRELGVDECIDYRATEFETSVHDVDVVFDTIGEETRQRSWKVLKTGGILVSIVRPPPQSEDAVAHRVRQVFVGVRSDSSQLAEIAKLIDAGELRTVVQTVLPLSEVRLAQELSQRGHVRGKIVLSIR